MPEEENWMKTLNFPPTPYPKYILIAIHHWKSTFKITRKE